MNLTRREFAKANAAAIAAAAAGLPILVRASNLVTEADVTSLVWNKAPCRFCGTGCSVMVAPATARWWPPMATSRPRSTAGSTA